MNLVCKYRLSWWTERIASNKAVSSLNISRFYMFKSTSFVHKTLPKLGAGVAFFFFLNCCKSSRVLLMGLNSFEECFLCGISHVVHPHESGAVGVKSTLFLSPY